MQKKSLLKSLKFILLLGIPTILGTYAAAVWFQPEKKVTHKFIDMHTHVACLGDGSKADGKCYISPEMKNSYKFSVYLKSFGVTVDELKQSQDLVVFDRLLEKIYSSKRVGAAVVLAMDAAVDRSTGEIDWKGTQVYVPNEFVLAGIRKRHSDRLYYGASINPYRKDAIERLEQAKKDGAVLVKWLPSTMNIDPSDPSLVPFYKKLIELHLPLLVHTGREQTFTDAKDQLCDPFLLKLPLDVGVTVIAAHLATTGENEGEPDHQRLKKLFEIEKYKDLLFADISSITQFNRVKNFSALIRDPLFRGRLLNGTDWPLIDVELFGLKLVPYKLYSTRLFGFILSSDQVEELGTISNSFDRDIRIKEFLGTPEELFYRAESLLNINLNEEAKNE
ncbi:MAG: amidohydrolase family protein [Bacteriovorax sp.]